MPDSADYELVNGELVERAMSAKSAWIAGRLSAKLSNHCDATGAGFVFPSENGYQCFPDKPRQVRKSDVSVILTERYTLVELNDDGWIRIPPDLAVEVVSPNDESYALDEKIQEYLEAGVKLVWVVHPNVRKVSVHRPDQAGTVLRDSDELTGEGVLPGFTCKIAELFMTPRGPLPAG
jgi:Uma2 family endonuclease